MSILWGHRPAAIESILGPVSQRGSRRHWRAVGELSLSALVAWRYRCWSESLGASAWSHLTLEKWRDRRGDVMAHGGGLVVAAGLNALSSSFAAALAGRHWSWYRGTVSLRWNGAAGDRCQRWKGQDRLRNQWGRGQGTRCSGQCRCRESRIAQGGVLGVAFQSQTLRHSECSPHGTLDVVLKSRKELIDPGRNYKYNVLVKK